MAAGVQHAQQSNSGHPTQTAAPARSSRRPNSSAVAVAKKIPRATNRTVGDREKCRGLIAKSTEVRAKKSAHDSGSLLARRLVVGTHPVAAAADVHDGRIPQEPVDDGRGDHWIGKDLAPVREAPV